MARVHATQSHARRQMIETPKFASWRKLVDRWIRTPARQRITVRQRDGATMADNEDPVIIEHDGAVATVTLNRPDRLNALNRPMWPLLSQAFTTLSADSDVRVIVLRGAGKAFSPGADISEFQSERPTAEGAQTYGIVMDAAYEAIRQTPQPVVARIQGPCTGAGLVLALLCDLRIGDTSVRMGSPVARIGLAMPSPEFSVLVDAMGRHAALALVLEAKVLEAEQAAAAGLLDRVVQPKELDTELGETLKRILAGAPLVHRAHKALARRLADPAPLSEDEVAASYVLFDSADYREGFRAFLEKRRPDFRGA